MPRIYQSPAKLSQFGLNAAGLTSALAAVSHIEIDRNVTLASAITIPEGKTISVVNGAVINATAALRINGNFIAPKVRVFSDASDIKFGQHAIPQLLPEWFGAKAMEDMRATDIDGDNIDNSAYFTKAIDSIDSIYNSEDEFTNTTILLGGVYGVGSKIVVKNKTVNFLGTSCYFSGTGFRFIGTLTGDPAQQYILEFDGANASKVENVCFRGKRTTNDATRMLGAINMICSTGGTPQRKLMFRHVEIGDRIGHWADSGLGYEFENGWVCGLEGEGLNNDFFGFYDIGVGNTRIGILNNLNMAVNWTIDKYAFNYGETMISYPNGGQFTGREWYPGTDSTGYMIKCGTNSGTTTRFEIYNFDSEHLKADGLVWGGGTVRGTFTNGHINNNGVDATGDGFKMLGGTADNFDPILEFHHITFLQEGTQKAYFDLSHPSGSRGYFKFVGCTAVEGLHFKMALAQSRATYYINVDGRKMPSTTDPNMFADVAINNQHPDVDVDGFLSMNSVITRGITDISYSIINLGIRGKGAQRSLRSVNIFKTTTATNTLTFNYQLPANVDIRGVTLTYHDSGVLASGYYSRVGDSDNPEKFGIITGTGSGVQNNFNATGGIVYTAPTSVIVTTFDGSDAPANLVTGKYIVLTIDYEVFGQSVMEMSVNALGELPNDDAL